MKKYIFALLLTFSLAGCRNTNMSEDMNRMKEDVRDGVNDMEDSIRDTYDKDMKNPNVQNSEDSYNQVPNDHSDTNNDIDNDAEHKPTASNLGLNLKELWTVPSFCNATIGTKLFRGF